MEEKNIDIEKAVTEEEKTTEHTEQEEAAKEVLQQEEEASEETKQEPEEKEEADEKKGFFKKKGKSAKTLEIELKKAKEETEEYKDRYQRLMAEFENARKRNAKETGRMYDMGAKDILEKLLPVVDNFERGLASATDEEKETPFVQGIDKIYKQLMTTLDELGVTPMEAEGKEFNPDFHNAVMHVENEELGENVVAAELQKGYMYKDMVLRHSMVTVAN